MSYSGVSPTDDYFKNIDIKDKIKIIIKYLQEQGVFLSKNKSVWQSRYWDKGIGAALIDGEFIKDSKKIPAVLKIQGAKPNYREPDLIAKFSQQNKSKILKVPQTFYQSDWDNHLKLEYYIFEKIEADPIIEPYKLTSEKKILEFFSIWQELKKSFVPAIFSQT